MMQDTHTEEEDIELITEWPVTSAYNEEDSHTSTSPTGDCCQSASTTPPQMDRHDISSVQHRLGKRQHPFLLTKHLAGEAAGARHTETSGYLEPWNEDRLTRNTFKHPRMSDLVNHAECADRLGKDGQILIEKVEHLDGSTVSESSSCFPSRESGVEKTKSTAVAYVRESPDKCVESAAQRELLAQPRMARWWRRQGRQLANSRGQGKTTTLPETSNPNTLLFHVARLPEGRAFLEGERQKLKDQSEMGKSRADVMAALGSIEEWLGNPHEAVRCLKQAVTKVPDNKEWRWLLHKAQRQQRVRRRQQELLSTVPPQPSFPPARQVDRVSCKDLSVADFLHQYASRRRPVIITDMVFSMTPVPWDLQHIRDRAGECQVRVKQSVRGSVEWAGLEDSKLLSVSEFLDRMQQGCGDYLFDWSLPLHCPGLAEELTIPRYFAGDLLQRSAPGSLYQDSWPSLFIAPPGVHSGLHVDAFASNFWMALFQGRKRWLFFQEEDSPCLYPVYAHSLDPTFEANVVNPDLTAHPLLACVHPIECILNAGELLFVPGGSPHYVQNLDTTLAISANFIDLSNFSRVLDELDINGLLDPRAADLVEQFKHPHFMSATKTDIGDLPWKEFKTPATR